MSADKAERCLASGCNMICMGGSCAIGNDPKTCTHLQNPVEKPQIEELTDEAH